MAARSRTMMVELSNGYSQALALRERLGFSGV
jgi:hypothetical protein